MRALITGGAGFIGSHLAERLLERGDEVLLMDNLSTGSMENIRHLKQYDRMHYFLEPIENRQLAGGIGGRSRRGLSPGGGGGRAADCGKSRPHDRDQRQRHATGARSGLQEAQAGVYRLDLRGLREEHECSLPRRRGPGAGATTKGRWSYAASKALDEFLALSYWKERRQPVVVARLFNTVGPRQTGRYGMVLPNLVAQALEASSAHGLRHWQADPVLLRCAGLRRSHPAIGRRTERAVGEVVNIGSTHEITIEALAEAGQGTTGSSSPLTYIPYEQAYEPGFEDMHRRVPSVEKLERLTDFARRRRFPKSWIEWLRI